MNIIDLFPIPLVIEPLEIDQDDLLSLSEYASSKDNFNINQNLNYVSKDTYLLEKTPKLKEKIEAVLKDYVYDILGEDSTLRITQSWINFNPPNTSHHKHTHSNSIVSGVIYLQCNDETGNFQVHRPAAQTRQVHSEITNWHQYSYDFMYFVPKVGEMFLFPSSLPHSVEENKSTISRVSLSFNTFYSGTFGSDVNLNQLTLR